MEQYQNVVQDLAGNVVPQAVVRVLLPNGGNATVYDVNGAQMSNPVPCDAEGYFAFQAANGKYFAQVEVANKVYKKLGPITLFDFADDDRAFIGDSLRQYGAVPGGDATAAALAAENSADFIYVPKGTFNIRANAPLLKKYYGPGTLAFSGLGAKTFTGSGINDLTLGGSFVQAVAVDAVVKINTSGAPDTIAYSVDGGVTFATTLDVYNPSNDQVEPQPIAITSAPVALPGTGATLIFDSTSGHTVGDSWSFKLTPNPQGIDTHSGIITKKGIPIAGVVGVLENNTFLGKDIFGAGKAVGNQNTGTGSRVFFNLTTGYANTGTGINALTSVTRGFSNCGYGADALFSLTSGYNCVGVGIYSGRHITTGQGIVGAGSDSNGYNQTGDNCTGLGTQTLYHNILGTLNVAVGAYAGRGGSESLSNGMSVSFLTAVGARALYNCRGNYNTGTGLEVLYGLTTGVCNTAGGAEAGFKIVTGSYNVIFGYQAGALSGQDPDASNCVIIGNDSFTTGDNSVAIGSGVSAGANQIAIGNPQHVDFYHFGHLNPQLDRAQDIGKPDGAYRNIYANNVIIRPPAAATPVVAGDMTFELTSNSLLKIKVKGSDGVVRSASLTLT